MAAGGTAPIFHRFPPINMKTPDICHSKSVYVDKASQLPVFCQPFHTISHKFFRLLLHNSIFFIKYHTEPCMKRKSTKQKLRSFISKLKLICRNKTESKWKYKACSNETIIIAITMGLSTIIQISQLQKLASNSLEDKHIWMHTLRWPDWNFWNYIVEDLIL